MKCNECNDEIPEQDMTNHTRFHRRNERDALISKPKKKAKIKRNPIDPDHKLNRFLEK